MKASENTIQYSYDTVSQAISDLAKRGYTIDFSLHPDKMVVPGDNSGISLSPDEFRIDEVYRFEGETDPGDEMIVFAVSSPDHRVKGIVVNAFGMYQNSQNSNLVKDLEKQLEN